MRKSRPVGAPRRPPRSKATRARLRKLRYSNDCEPGISRRRAGKGFVYRAPSGDVIRDAATLSRVRALAIPPAYTEVWICEDRRGHLQATGRDARGRKQYRYHADWRDYRDARKYRRLLRFGERLPALRVRLRRDMARDGLPRDKVLAIMTKVVLATSMRVGSVEYARTNHSYGLTTLRARHLSVRGGVARFQFRGKGGKRHATTITNHRLARLLRRCAKLPGTALFQYDDDGVARRIGARQYNQYLHEAMGLRFSAKDFRTWAGTLTVIAQLARAQVPKRGGERACRAAIGEAVAVAAQQLGNTPAICRKAYVCPQVLTGWRSGALHRAVPADARPNSRRLEKAALRFIKGCLAEPVTTGINNRGRAT